MRTWHCITMHRFDVYKFTKKSTIWHTKYVTYAMQKTNRMMMEFINDMIHIFRSLVLYFNIGCPTSDFTCGNGSCLPMEHTCDGTADCDDQSDEVVFLCKSEFYIFFTSN